MKIRLDQYLTDNGLASGRDKAKALIMSGIVYVNDQKSEKAGALIQDTDKVEVRGNTLKYVSRGGLKLEKAMDTWCITLNDKICMDIAAVIPILMEHSPVTQPTQSWCRPVSSSEIFTRVPSATKPPSKPRLSSPAPQASTISGSSSRPKKLSN